MISKFKCLAFDRISAALTCSFSSASSIACGGRFASQTCYVYTTFENRAKLDLLQLKYVKGTVHEGYG